MLNLKATELWHRTLCKLMVEIFENTCKDIVANLISNIILLKGFVHKLAHKESFPSNVSESNYFINILLFDIEIEH